MRRTALSIIVVLVAGLAGFTYYCYRREIHAARARVSSGSQIVNTPCGPIEFAAAGSGPPLLVIHGAGGGFDQGLEFTESLIERGFRVIAPSRFGYLRTPLPADASPAAQADAHACLLDALKLDRVAVLGGSAGASSAMQLCLRHPERCSALVLLVPAIYAPRLLGALPGGPPPKPSAVAQFLLRTTLRSDFAFWAASKLARGTLVETILATPLSDFRSAPPYEQQRVLRALQHILPISLREKGLLNDAAVVPALPRFDLERIAVPTLVISAEDDRFGTFAAGRYAADHIPGARFIGYPSGGHLLVGHNNEASAAVIEFLRQISGEQHATRHGTIRPHPRRNADAVFTNSGHLSPMTGP